MDAEAKARLVAALRSGAYEQGFAGLRTEDTYCVLGVLCDVSELGAWDSNRGISGTFSYKVGAVYGAGFPPVVVREWAGLSEQEAQDLAILNDESRTLAEIADYVEENL